MVKRIDNLASSYVPGFMDVKTLDNQSKIVTKPVTTLNKTESKNVMGDAVPMNSVFNEIIEEVGKEVFDYLEKFKITRNQNILFLSYTRHYLYDSEQLKQVGTLLNFKPINRIPHLWYYFFTMNRILPMNGYFIGSYVDYQTQRERMINSKHSLLGHLFLYVYRFVNRVVPRIPVVKKLQLLFNSSKIKCMTRIEATALLEKSGFQMLDMTEIEGLTFFISQKIQSSDEKTASLWNLLTYFKTKSHVINI